MFPIILYRCEMLSLTLREQHRMRVLKIKSKKDKYEKFKNIHLCTMSVRSALLHNAHHTTDYSK